MLRRSAKSVLKFLFLSLLTMAATVIVFRIVRTPNASKKNVTSDFRVDEKIDWHDYEMIELEHEMKGPGEQGRAAKLSDKDDVNEKEALYKVNGFNALLSDQISLKRSLPDIRHPGCQEKKYLARLNSVSVIVPFHNEHLSTLLRTAYSVIRRSPPQLLKEVILVDDNSTKTFLKQELDRYVKRYLPKVRVLRLPERVGLIRARLAGAKEATSEVLLFLDSHTEANVNWLPPLLEPIMEDYKTCVCPFIDVIDYDTFQYRAQDEGKRGAFDWEFFYKRLDLLPEDLKRPTEPFKSPVMAGGLFAISARFFWELGGYDDGLDIWGGEQYELSFKIWQCGGQLLDAPCSRVGHIYRKFAPFPNPGRGDFVGKNYRRVAEVWMDEYAEYLYMRRSRYRNIDPGDLTKQKAIREKLQCKPFKWFMENIAFDLPLKYPPIEPPDFGQGEIKSLSDETLCVDTEFKTSNERFGLKPCTKGVRGGNKGEQSFSLTWHKDIRPKKRDLCWDVSSLDEKAPVNLFSCHGMKGNQLWRFDMETSQLIHGGNPRCLTADTGEKAIFVTQCDDSDINQKWHIEEINKAAMANWHNSGPS